METLFYLFFLVCIFNVHRLIPAKYLQPDEGVAVAVIAPLTQEQILYKNQQDYMKTDHW